MSNPNAGQLNFDPSPAPLVAYELKTCEGLCGGKNFLREVGTKMKICGSCNRELIQQHTEANRPISIEEKEISWCHARNESNGKRCQRMIYFDGENETLCGQHLAMVKRLASARKSVAMRQLAKLGIV